MTLRIGGLYKARHTVATYHGHVCDSEFVLFVGAYSHSNSTEERADKFTDAHGVPFLEVWVLCGEQVHLILLNEKEDIRKWWDNNFNCVAPNGV